MEGFDPRNFIEKNGIVIAAFTHRDDAELFRVAKETFGRTDDELRQKVLDSEDGPIVRMQDDFKEWCFGMYDDEVRPDVVA